MLQMKRKGIQTGCNLMIKLLQTPAGRVTVWNILFLSYVYCSWNWINGSVANVDGKKEIDKRLWCNSTSKRVACIFTFSDPQSVSDLAQKSAVCINHKLQTSILKSSVRSLTAWLWVCVCSYPSAYVCAVSVYVCVHPGVYKVTMPNIQEHQSRHFPDRPICRCPRMKTAPSVISAR